MVEEISPLEIRLLVVDDLVAGDDVDVAGGETTFAALRLCVLVACGFGFKSPSGIGSSFSLAEQLLNKLTDHPDNANSLLIIHHVRIICTSPCLELIWIQWCRIA